MSRLTALALAASAVAVNGFVPLTLSPSRSAAPEVVARTAPSEAPRAEPFGWSLLALGALAAAHASWRRRTPALASSKPVIVSVQSGASVFAGQPDLKKSLSPFQVRGGETTSTGRKVRVTMFLKTDRAPFSAKRRQAMYLDFTQHLSKFNKAKTQMASCRMWCMKVWKQMWRSRMNTRRVRKRLVVMRMSSVGRIFGVRYRWIAGELRRANMALSRKMITHLWIYDRDACTAYIEEAIPNWRALVEAANTPPKTVNNMSQEETDALMIPYLEKMYPRLYTDPCIRFNRRMIGDKVVYTVDVGDPKDWQEILPRSPELANFNFPDHWAKKATAWGDQEELKPETFALVTQGPREYELDEITRAREEFKTWKTKTAGKKVLLKEGVSREDWFKDEPQTWF